MSTKKKEKSNISNKLKKLRSYQDLTIKRLAGTLNINSNTYENYEFNNFIPPIQILTKIANFFHCSVDYLLSDSSYVKNIELLELSEKIDKFDSGERFKIESTVETLLKKNRSDCKSTFDTIEIELQDTVHKNIKILREHREISQRELSRELQKSFSVVNQYESGVNNPSPDNLLVLSNFFNVSIHYLITGRKLFFYFRNEAFKDTMLKADTQLTLEQHKFIIELMTNIIDQA